MSLFGGWSDDKKLPVADVVPVPSRWLSSSDPLAWPWGSIDSLPPLRLANGSGPARQQTAVRLAHAEQRLYVHFDCIDSDIWGTYTRRDEPIFDQEVVELFLAPGDDAPVHYAEFEVSPHGVLLDAWVHNPTGRRAEMQVDLGWDCPDLHWMARRDDRDDRWQALLDVPLTSLTDERPLPARWRANLYRIERPRDGQAEFSCWSPTLVEPADFHKPHRFGTLVLQGAG